MSRRQKRIGLWICLCLGALIVALIKTRPEQMQRPDLTVIGFVALADGLGQQGVELIECVKEGLLINFKHSRRKNEGEIRTLSPKMRAIITSPNEQNGKVVFFEDALYYPYAPFYEAVEQIDDVESIKIAYSVMESSKIPSEWVLILNSVFDAVVVPDPYLVDVYRACGVLIPIFSIPLSFPMEDLLSLPLKEKAGDPFVFTNLSSVGVERKNQLTLVKAFAKAFKDNPHVLLKMNAKEWDPAYKKEVLKLIEQESLSNVFMTEKSLSRAEYRQELFTSDCFVNVSKGEGFSVPPREAMALGIPVIASNNTAQQTLCRTGLVKALSVSSLERASYREGFNPGFFFQTSEDELAKAMSDVYQHYSTYLQTRKLSRKWVMQYQRSRLRDLYKTLIKPSEVVLSHENTLEDGILYTDSESLYEKYKKLGMAL